jgi:pimeloyl-ACP methyl ester carboxylesterase
MATFALHDYQLHYSAHIFDRDYPTVLFIHEFTLDATEWTPVLQNLAPCTNVVTYDQFGHGHTKANDQPLTLEVLVAECYALINHLKLDKIHIVGSGMGGNIGFELARRYPSRVSSLILMSSGFFFTKNLENGSSHSLPN